MPSIISPSRTLLVAIFSLVGVQSALGQVDAVSATGPEIGLTLEDRVEITWTTAITPANTSSFVIKRSDVPPATPNYVDLGVASSRDSLFDDFSAIPDVKYDYCVFVRDAVDVETQIACDRGMRKIARPTDFQASDGTYEEGVVLGWADQSQIETGFNLYRDAGNALDLDGVDDYVSVPGVSALPPREDAVSAHVDQLGPSLAAEKSQTMRKKGVHLNRENGVFGFVQLLDDSDTVQHGVRLHLLQSQGKRFHP